MFSLNFKVNWAFHICRLHPAREKCLNKKDINKCRWWVTAVFMSTKCCVRMPFRCRLKQTIPLFERRFHTMKLNHRLGRATNQAIVEHLVYDSQRTDCQHQHFYWNGNDDLQWKRWQSRRALHVSRHGKRHCITCCSIYCRFTWSICVAMVIVHCQSTDGWHGKEEMKKMHNNAMRCYVWISSEEMGGGCGDDDVRWF